jgi:hypothetical protein
MFDVDILVHGVPDVGFVFLLYQGHLLLLLFLLALLLLLIDFHLLLHYSLNRKIDGLLKKRIKI